MIKNTSIDFRWDDHKDNLVCLEVSTCDIERKGRGVRLRIAGTEHESWLVPAQVKELHEALGLFLETGRLHGPPPSSIVREVTPEVEAAVKGRGEEWRVVRAYPDRASSDFVVTRQREGKTEYLEYDGEVTSSPYLYVEEEEAISILTGRLEREKGDWDIHLVDGTYVVKRKFRELYLKPNGTVRTRMYHFTVKANAEKALQRYLVLNVEAINTAVREATEWRVVWKEPVSFHYATPARWAIQKGNQDIYLCDKHIMGVGPHFFSQREQAQACLDNYPAK